MLSHPLLTRIKELRSRLSEADREVLLNFDEISYDIVWAYAYAAHTLLSEGKSLDGDNMLKALKSVRFQGVSGNFSFNELGNRPSRFDIVNNNGGEDKKTEFLQPQVIGSWNQGILKINTSALVWPSGTSEIPNLRLPVKYWSCHDRRSYKDSTG